MHDVSEKQELINVEKKEIKKHFLWALGFAFLFYLISNYVENEIIVGGETINVAKDLMKEVCFAFLMLLGVFVNVFKLVVCYACMSYLEKE